MLMKKVSPKTSVGFWSFYCLKMERCITTVVELTDCCSLPVSSCPPLKTKSVKPQCRCCEFLWSLGRYRLWSSFVIKVTNLSAAFVFSESFFCWCSQSRAVRPLIDHTIGKSYFKLSSTWPALARLSDVLILCSPISGRRSGREN